MLTKTGSIAELVISHTGCNTNVKSLYTQVHAGSSGVPTGRVSIKYISSHMNAVSSMKSAVLCIRSVNINDSLEESFIRCRLGVLVKLYHIIRALTYSSNRHSNFFIHLVSVNSCTHSFSVYLFYFISDRVDS